MSLIDPKVAELAATAAGTSPLHAIGAPAARERVARGNALCAPGPCLHSVEDHVITLDDVEVPIRIYRPATVKADRTLCFFHGGGWVTGDLDYSDALCRFIAQDASCTVVSVAYRLAPEHPYPEPLRDAWNALKWVQQNVASGAPIAIGGDSAGGNLAASCALKCRDEGLDLAFQVLIYPVVDHDFSRPSYVAHGEAFPLGAEAMQWFWTQYSADNSRDDPALAPLRAQSLKGLAPAHIILAGHDPLHDEGATYGQRLKADGVAVTVLDYDTLPHGFYRLTAAVPSAADAVSDLTRSIDAHFTESSMARAMRP